MGRNKKMHQPIEHTFAQVIEKIASPETDYPTTLQAKPFVKWVGGKRSIMKELVSRIPDEFNSYYEPFVGGGAFFFHTQPHSAFLSDFNLSLIIAYTAIRDNVDDLIIRLKKHEKLHSASYYLKSRDKFNKTSDPMEIAGLLIYLNKTCFNGLYRVNKSGGFNVPMGNYSNPLICDESNLKSVSRLLKGISILQHSFEQIAPSRGDFVYLDPPYHETYNGYGSGGFDDDMHRKLASFCNELSHNGVHFMLSNSNTDFVRDLYKGYTIECVSALRSVSCKVKSRGKESEIIIRNY